MCAVRRSLMPSDERLAACYGVTQSTQWIFLSHPGGESPAGHTALHPLRLVLRSPRSGRLEGRPRLLLRDASQRERCDAPQHEDRSSERQMGSLVAPLDSAAKGRDGWETER
jgi:hypothetical protein